MKTILSPINKINFTGMEEATLPCLDYEKYFNRDNSSEESVIDSAKQAECELLQSIEKGNNQNNFANIPLNLVKTFNENEYHYSTFQELSKRNNNIEILSSLKSLEYNWNDNGANPFKEDLILKSITIIENLQYQPEVFPTARESIQFEFTNKLNEYLELEIFSDYITLYQETLDSEEEIVISIDEINRILEQFYERK